MAKQSDELKFLLKHSSIYGVGNVLNKAVAFLMLPLYTRYLTPTDYGILELIDTTTGLIGIVVGLGVAGAVSRFYYERQEETERARLVSTVYVLLTVGAIIVVTVASLAAPALAVLVLDGERYTSYLRIAFLAMAIGVVVDVGQAYLRMRYQSVLFITLSTLSLIVGVSLNVFFIVHLHLGVLSILYTSVIIRCLIGVPLTISILYRTGLRFSRADATALLKYSLPLLPATIGNTLVQYSDRFFVKSLISVADAGIYGLAQKLGGILHMLVTGPFIVTFQPRRFQLAEERSDLPEVLQTVFDSFSFVLLFLSLMVAMFTPEVMAIMTTPQFYRAGLYVPILLVSNFIFALKYHVDWGIMHSGKTHYYMWANILTAGVQLVGAFFFIRAFGVLGACVAVTLSTLVNVILLHVFSWRVCPVAFNFARISKVLAVAALVYLVSMQVPTTHLVWAIVLKTMLLAGYLAVLPLIGLVSRSEISHVRALVLSVLRKPAAPVGA